MTDRVVKTSVANPRRSSHRAAKTTAITALTIRSTSNNAKRALAITKASITPLHDIRNKFPPKKRWKARGQLLLSDAAAKVTPHRATIPPPVIHPFSIKSVGKRSDYGCSPNTIDGTPRSNNIRHRSSRTKALKNNDTKKSRRPVRHTSTTKTKKMKIPEEPPVLLPLREQASPEPLILVTLNLDGGFVDSASKGIRKLRSVKVTTYCHQGDNSFSQEAFPVKLYHMVQFATLEYPQACRWSQDGSHVEVNSKNPVLSSIIRRYFKHSKWLSFSRQLNNYGFNCTATKKTEMDGNNKDRNHEVKSYHHPQFHRDIEDLIGLSTLLPYLPGLRKREKAGAAKSSQPSNGDAANAKTTKKSKTIVQRHKGGERSTSQGKDFATLVDFFKTPSPQNRKPKAKTERTAKKSKTMVRHQGSERSTSQGKDIVTLVDFFKTPSPQNRKPKAKTGTKRPKPAAAVTATSNHGDEANARTSKKSKTMVQRQKGGDRSTLQGKDVTTLVDFFKTPSPRYRKHKAKFMSSPPPLSHYLQPKNNAPYRQPFPDPHGQEQNAADGSTSTLASSVIESPLPSSLLTVNFVMTPSPLPSDEPTPRINNLSSSLVAAASSLQESRDVVNVNVNVNVNPSSPDDGVRMLSWAAHAVESPAFQKDDEDHQKTTRTTPNGKTTTTTRVKFTEAIGCSPIIHTTKAPEQALTEAIHKCYSPTTAYSSSSSAATSYSPMIRHPTMYYNDDIGPSPLSFRDHHQDTEIELEMLRNCLEDVFVSGTSSGTSTSATNVGSVVSSHCGSVTLTSDGTNEVLEK